MDPGDAKVFHFILYKNRPCFRFFNRGVHLDISKGRSALQLLSIRKLLPVTQLRKVCAAAEDSATR